MYDHIPLLGFSVEFGGIMSAYKKGVCHISISRRHNMWTKYFPYQENREQDIYMTPCVPKGSDQCELHLVFVVHVDYDLLFVFHVSSYIILSHA